MVDAIDLTKPAPGSPAWWIKTLNDKLDVRVAEFKRLRKLVDDEHDPANTTENSDKFQMIAGMSTTNLCGLVVDVTAERINVQGVQVGDTPDADSRAWSRWADSDFVAGSSDAIANALVYSRGVVSVDPADGRMINEDPMQVIIAHSSDGRRDRLAAWKVFTDEWTGAKFGTLYLPNRLYKFQETATPALGLGPAWIPRIGDAAESDNPIGEVPFFELRNRIAGRTRSEIANIEIPQRRLNQAIYNTDAVAEAGAFLQKWAANIEVPLDAAGKPVSPYSASVTKLWIAASDPDNPTAEPRFGTFDATPLDGYITLGQEIAAHVSRLSGVPITYFLSNISNLGGDALALLVSRLVTKCERRVIGYEPAFAGATRLSMRVTGDDRWNQPVQILWAPMETRSLAQDADAVGKLTTGDDPVVTRQLAQEKYLGLSQTERNRDAQYRTEAAGAANLDRLLAVPDDADVVNAPVATPAAPVG